MARRVKEPQQDPVLPLNRRVATVIGINETPPSVNVHLNGSDIPSVKVLKGYAPVVGDTAIIEFSGTDPLCIGALADVAELCWNFGALPGLFCLGDVAGVTTIRGLAKNIQLVTPQGYELDLIGSLNTASFRKSGVAAVDITSSQISMYHVGGSRFLAISSAAQMDYNVGSGAFAYCQAVSDKAEMGFTGGGAQGSVRVTPSTARIGWTTGTSIDVNSGEIDFFRNSVLRAFIDSTFSAIQSGNAIIRASTSDALLWFNSTYLQSSSGRINAVVSGAGEMNWQSDGTRFDNRAFLNSYPLYTEAGTIDWLGDINGFGPYFTAGQFGASLAIASFDNDLSLRLDTAGQVNVRNNVSNAWRDIVYRTAFPQSDSRFKTGITPIAPERLLAAIKANQASQYSFIDDPASELHVGIMADGPNLPIELSKTITGPSSSTIVDTADGKKEMIYGPTRDVAFINFNAQVGWLWESMRHLIGLLEAANVITVPIASGAKVTGGGSISVS